MLSQEDLKVIEQDLDAGYLAYPDLVRQLIADNRRLIEENQLLKDRVKLLEGEIDSLRNNITKYLTNK